MISIARSELVQIFRNRAVLLTSLLMPVAVSVFFVSYRETFAAIGSLGYVAAVIVFTSATFTLYATTVSTLAARRQTMFLKRLRSTAASDSSILMGLLLPISVVSLVQVAAVLVVFAVVTQESVDVPLLALTVVASFVMMLALGIATAGVTRTPEHAQVTILPLSLGVIAVTSWVGITGVDELAWLKRLLPGGASTEVVLDAWDGGSSLLDSLTTLAPTFAWVVVAIAVATRIFRWEPRR